MGRGKKRERECMYMARHGDRVGRAATLLGRLKYCSPMFSDCASSIFRVRSSKAQPSSHLHDTLGPLNGKWYESTNERREKYNKIKKKKRTMFRTYNADSTVTRQRRWRKMDVVDGKIGWHWPTRKRERFSGCRGASRPNIFLA